MASEADSGLTGPWDHPGPGWACILDTLPSQAEDNEKFKTIVEFECRGLEPVDFQPQVPVSPGNLYVWGGAYCRK